MGSVCPAVVYLESISLHWLWMEQDSSGVLINVCLTPCCLSDLLDSPLTGSTANCWFDLLSATNAGCLLLLCGAGSLETMDKLCIPFFKGLLSLGLISA